MGVDYVRRATAAFAAVQAETAAAAVTEVDGLWRSVGWTGSS